MKKLLISILLIFALCTPVQATMPHTFAALTGTVPLSYLDDDFAYLYAFFGTITSTKWCYASATNVITCDVTPLVAGSNVQAYNAYLTGINQNLTTTSSPQFTAVTATTLTGALTGTASGNLTSAAIGTTVQGYNANTAIGPGTSTANHIAKFSGTDGKTLADGGVLGTAAAAATTAFAPATSGSVPLKGNGTGGTSAAVAADVVALWTTGGACLTGYLAHDGSCSTSTGMIYPATTGLAYYDSGTGTWGTTVTNIVTKAMMYGSGTQSLPSGSFTKVILNTSAYDVLTELDVTAFNYNWTATITGYYRFTAGCEFQGNVSGSLYQIALYSDGFITAPSNYVTGTGFGGNTYLTLSFDSLATAGHVFDLRCAQNTGSSVNLLGANYRTFFQVHRIFP